MPQMAPLSWTILFMFFTASLLMVSMMNYYNWIPTPSRIKEGGISQKKNTMNWKW